jgi:hypothetical protein
MALLRIMRTSLAIAACMYGAAAVAHAQLTIPQDSEIRDPHVLPNPTPRPFDVRQRYDKDPIEKQKLDRAIAAKNELRQEKVVSDTEKLFLLATQLKANVELHSKDGTPYPESLKAEQIEKLAKTVKDKMRSD